MEETLITFIEQFGVFSYAVSILVNIFLNVLAVIPTAFMTTINIVVFDLHMGVLITFIGEIIGTIISFYLYRLGLRKIDRYLNKYSKWIDKIRYAQGKKAFYYILLARLIPIIPSSIVTIAASYSSINGLLFFIASLIGKIPALALEVLLIIGFLQLNFYLQIFLLVIVFIFILWKIVKSRQKNRHE